MPGLLAAHKGNNSDPGVLCSENSYTFTSPGSIECSWPEGVEFSAFLAIWTTFLLFTAAKQIAGRPHENRPLSITLNIDFSQFSRSHIKILIFITITRLQAFSRWYTLHDFLTLFRIAKCLWICRLPIFWALQICQAAFCVARLCM